MLTVTKDPQGRMRSTVHVRAHTFPVDVAVAAGGEDSGADPHDLFDAALGACKALTTLWYARRHAMPLESIEVAVERDGRDEQQGRYRLHTSLSLGGPLTESQRADLLSVAAKCPIHKLMTTATIDIETVLVPVEEERDGR